MQDGVTDSFWVDRDEDIVMKQNNHLDLRVQRADGVVVHFPAVSVLLSWLRAGHVGPNDMIRVRNRQWQPLGETEYGVITRRGAARAVAASEELEVEAAILNSSDLDADLATALPVFEFEVVSVEYELARA
jgi:hypothetical protein